jgi:hypothetical protein
MESKREFDKNKLIFRDDFFESHEIMKTAESFETFLPNFSEVKENPNTLNICIANTELPKELQNMETLPLPPTKKLALPQTESETQEEIL